MFYDLLDSEGAVLKSRIRLLPTTPSLLPGQTWVVSDPQMPIALPVVPHVVSRFQGMAALDVAGYLTDIEAHMALETTSAMEKLAWREIQEFRRSSPLLAQMAALLTPPLSDTQIDDLFFFAATIEA